MKDKLTLNEDFDIPGADEAADMLGYDPDAEPTLEDQGWEYVASKDVYDEDGFRDVYYWYKKDGNNRFFFSSDVDYGDPEYFDWETEGDKAAQEWFDSYGKDEDELTFVDNREAAILGKGDDPGFDEYDKVDEAVNISDEEDSTDTLDDIAACFEKVNQPKYRGAKMPPYNADAINESEFPDNMRAKYYTAQVTRDGRIAFSWVTQEPFTDVDADIFKKELDRYFTRIVDNSNYEGPIHVDVTVSCRDGNEWGHSKFTLSYPDDQFEESFNNSSSSYYLTTVGDMIDGSVGNVDDEDIDKDLKFWRTVARTFNFVPGADNVAVLIADGEYDPEYYYPSWTNKPRAIAKKYSNAVFYDVPFFCVKEEKNGKMFLYFDSEESAKKYVDLIDSGIDFEDQSNFDNLDESYNKDLGYDPSQYFMTYVKVDGEWKPWGLTLKSNADVRRDTLTKPFMVGNVKNPGYEDVKFVEIDEEGQIVNESCKKSVKEDTVKQGSSWVNKGKEGTHGKFNTKKEADAQRKAMFAQGFKESLTEDPNQPTDTTVAGRLITAINDEWKTIDLYNSIISELSNTDGDDYKKMIPVIEDIVNEENVHVGQLQKALELISPDTTDIAKGEKEAEEQISGGDPADDKKALVDESCNKTVKESLDDDDIDIEGERWEDTYEYGDDADEYDDFELAGIYGGDLTYCPICGRRLQYDEDGDSFCPKCEKSAWDLAQERRKRDRGESEDFSDDLSDEEMNEAYNFSTEIEEDLNECDYSNLEDDPAVDVSDLRAPTDPYEKEKLQEFGPAAAAIVSAVAPVVADKVLDKILPEDTSTTSTDETDVQGAGEEDDIDESVLNTL